MRKRKLGKRYAVPLCLTWGIPGSHLCEWSPCQTVAMRIFIGSDHAGFELKARLLARLKELGHEPVDPIGPSALTVSGCIGIAVREAPTHVAIW